MVEIMCSCCRLVEIITDKLLEFNDNYFIFECIQTFLDCILKKEL